MFEELPESIEFVCVHWDRRDWGWGDSFRDSPPTSMPFTFMFGFSPAADKTHSSYIHNSTASTCHGNIASVQDLQRG